MTGWPHTLYSSRPVLGHSSRVNEALGRAEDAARMRARKAAEADSRAAAVRFYLRYLGERAEYDAACAAWEQEQARLDEALRVACRRARDARDARNALYASPEVRAESARQGRVAQAERAVARAEWEARNVAGIVAYEAARLAQAEKAVAACVAGGGDPEAYRGYFDSAPAGVVRQARDELQRARDRLPRAEDALTLARSELAEALAAPQEFAAEWAACEAASAAYEEAEQAAVDARVALLRTHAARMPYWLVWAEIDAGRCGPGLVARALAS